MDFNLILIIEKHRTQVIKYIYFFQTIIYMHFCQHINKNTRQYGNVQTFAVKDVVVCAY